MKRFGPMIVVIVLCVSNAWAQSDSTHQLGIRSGVGSFGHTSTEKDENHFLLGAELCTYCKGTYAMFADYTHYFASGSNGFRRAELASGGIRLQTAHQNRWFFDAGVAVSNSRFAGSSTVTSAGAAFGGGIQFRTASGLYFTPQFRFYLMHNAFSGMSGMSIGRNF